MNNNDALPAQVPLYEQLVSVPKDARLVIDDGPYSTQYIPVGRMCHEAAAALLATYKPIESGGGPTKRQYDTAMRQWEHWKAYALELQKRLVKYEGGSPMFLNTQPQSSTLPEVESIASDMQVAIQNGELPDECEAAADWLVKTFVATINTATLKEKP